MNHMFRTLAKKVGAITALSVVYTTTMAQSVSTVDYAQIVAGSQPGVVQELIAGASAPPVANPSETSKQSALVPYAQVDSGSIGFNRNAAANRIDYAYDTGFRPTLAGAFVCDFYFYTGYIPTGNLVIKVDDLVIGNTAQAVSSMGKTARGTCLMSGYLLTDFKIPPGTLKVTGTMVYAFNQLGTTSNSVTVPACTGIYAGTPQFTARHNGYTDNFYTTTESSINYALTLGFINKHVAFRMPEQYWGYLLAQRPFERFFHGAPQIEHFYSTSESESTFVRNFGYTPEGVEGWVFNTQKAGTVPLHRYARFYPAITDLEHYYSTTFGDPQSFGMDYEKDVGYVCAP
jgi:hypothetical protein